MNRSTPTPAPAAESPPTRKRPRVRVLLVEDEPLSAELVQLILREDRVIAFAVTWVDTLAAALASLEQDRHDVVLLDLGLPDSQGIDTVTQIHARAPLVPIVVLSAQDNVELAIQTLSHGAQDYLIKGEADSHFLKRALRYAMERARVEQALAQQQQLFAALMENVPSYIYFKDQQSHFVQVSRALAAKFGLADPAAAIGKTDFDMFQADHAQAAFDDEQRVMQTGEPIVRKVERETMPDGSITWALTSKLPYRDPQGRIIGTFGISADITAMREMEEKLAAERTLLRSVIDNLPDRIYVKDRQRRYVIDNRAHARFLGAARPEDVVGKTASDFFSAERAAAATCEDDAVIESGQPVLNHEEVLVHADGQQHWSLTTKVPLRDATGAIIGIVGISRDITERKAMEAKLAAEHDLLRSLVDALPDQIYVKDADCRFLLVNSALIEFFDTAHVENVLNKTDFDFFPQGLAQQFFDEEQGLIHSGVPLINREASVTEKDGTIRWVLTTKVPLRDSRGSVIGLVGINRDITKLHQLNEDLAHSQRELMAILEDQKRSHAELTATHEELKMAQTRLIQAAKMESVGRLSAGVAHEVKNPLAIILMGASYLADNLPGAGDDVKMVLREIHDAVERADGIIRELLDYSAPSGLEFSEENLSDIVRRALLLVRHGFSQHRIRVVTHLAEQLPLLRLDHVKIEQVFVNLFINATHAMPNGGTLTVTVTPQSLADGHPGVVAVVEDTGHGIPPENLAKLFEPFFTTKPAGSGTGLGLAVAKSIVESHGGSISLDNRPEGGVRAIVTFNT